MLNVTVAQVNKKFPTFYGTGRFYTVFRKSPARVDILSQMNAIHTVMLCFFAIHVTADLPSTSPSSKLPLTKFSNSNFLCISYLSHVCHMSRQPHSLEMIFVITFGKE